MPKLFLLMSFILITSLTKGQDIVKNILGSWDLQYQLKENGDTCESLNSQLVFNSNHTFTNLYDTGKSFGKWKLVSKNEVYFYNTKDINFKFNISNYKEKFTLIKDVLIFYHTGGDAICVRSYYIRKK